MYIPMSSIENALKVNEAAWGLMKPSGYAGVTTRYTIVYVHPITGAAVIYFPDLVTVPLLNPDYSPLAALMAPFIAAGLVQQSEVDAIRAKAIANQGLQVSVKDYLPAYFLGLSQTHDQLQAAGWFPTLTPPSN